jgi:hypothetical protein
MSRLVGAVITKSIEVSAVQSTEVPFPPSWVDRLIARIERLPGPALLYYVLGALVLGVTANALFWLDGSLPAGSMDPILTFFGVFIVYWLGLYQYLTGVGSRALQEFRPLLDADDSEIARIDYELETLPRRLGWLAFLVGFGLATAMEFGDPAPFGDLIPHTVLPYIVDIAATGFLICTFFCVIIRSIRQLRMVRNLHARATNINLLKLGPAHAFSALTARTAIGLILVPLLGLLAPSATGSISTALNASLTIGTILLAIAVFALPVMGIRDHIEKEKQRMLNETSDLIQTTSDGLRSQIGNRDYGDLKGMDIAITALIRERELTERISTWPWDSRTIRGFATTLMLPILVGLVTRVVERLL